jgi:hypothetical protein
MATRKGKTKSKRPVQAVEQLNRQEITTLRRIKAQRREISRLLRQVTKLAAIVEGEILTFAIGVVQASGRGVVEAGAARPLEPSTY